MHRTPTIQEQRRLVAERKRTDFEAYREWEYKRRLYDEITDVAERVRAPIEPEQEFALTAKGLVSERGELLRPVIEGGLREAQRMAVHNPDWQVEVERDSIDLEEYDEYEILAKAGPGSGAIVSYWLIPDAVRQGRSLLPGYNRERLKMFTRIAVPTEKGLAIKYHSYDGSYLPGVQAMDEALGFTFDPTLSSEERARQRRHIDAPVESIDELDEILRQAYDGAMTRDFGGEWHGGRRPIGVKDIMGFITAQHTLLDEHMAHVSKIFALVTDPHERNRLMEPHRYDLAAAIDDLIHGKTVASAADAGVSARAEGRNLDGDCPTGQAPTTAEQLSKVGFKSLEESLKCVKCPLKGCGKTVDAKVTHEGGIYCPACKREARDGEIIDHNLQTLGKRVTQQFVQLQKPEKQAQHPEKMRVGQKVRLPNGEVGIVMQRMGVGTAWKVIQNIRTGEEIKL
ncbi:MAG: hypothetical protein ACREGJ_03730 [Candidatus Saccharimonadales bacterium]